ncbi:hypothetical protein GCM10028820_18580 [Tessaracoccus terricola]
MLDRRRLLLLTGLGAAAVALGACTDRPVVASEEVRSEQVLLDLPHDSTPGVADAARLSADLAWAVLSADPTANRVVAPSTMAITLAMLAEGAAGGTADELDDVFGLAGDERSAAFGALRQSLGPYEALPSEVDVDDPPETPVVHQASQVVVIDEAEVKETFLDRLASYYDAALQRTSRDEAKAVLDEWARTNTAGLVEESAIEVTPRLRLVLQDAILFAAAWRTPFSSDGGTMEFDGPGGPVTVPSLHGDFWVPYAEGDGWQAARLPYDEALAMDVVLPAPGRDPASLTAQQLQEAGEALDGAEDASVSLTMPPTDLEHMIDLLAAFEAMGITFEDVSGIFDGAEVTAFVQQVRLMVSAKGTVGAAVTEVAVEESAVAVDVSMVVDRPFVMRVLDTRTGWPLFLAVVGDAAAMGAEW